MEEPVLKGKIYAIFSDEEERELVLGFLINSLYSLFLLFWDRGLLCVFGKVQGYQELPLPAL